MSLVNNEDIDITKRNWGDFEAAGTSGAAYQIKDYRLQSPGSPCIDAADNNAVTICSADLDGKERFFDDLATDPDTGNGTAPIVDMGAYEFGSPPPPDCNANGTPDECDIANGKSEDSNPEDGVPDECDCGPCRWDTPLSGPNGQVGAEDLAFLLGNWGPIPPDPDPAVLCLDIEPNGVIGAFDLANLLGNWGPCPP